MSNLVLMFLQSYCNLRQFSKQESTTLVSLPPTSDT